VTSTHSYVDRFPNEGGFLGASSPATLRQFLPEDEQYIRSVSWDHHDNFVNFWGDKDVTYRSVEYWLGKSHNQMTYDEYIFGSALLQAEALTEYISNFHQRMLSSASAIFWMYNESWPVTHGWTIVDYYNRKKLAYHPVRRAFDQLCVVVTEESDKINVYGINDTGEEWKGELQYGIFKTRGGFLFDDNIEVTLKANESTLIASFDKSKYEKAGYTDHGAFAVLKSNDIPVAQYKLLMEKFKDMKLEKPQISITQQGDGAILTSPVFVWAVCIDIDGEAPVSDNCFDLLPDVPYYVKLDKGTKISVKQTGSDLMLMLNTK